MTEINEKKNKPLIVIVDDEEEILVSLRSLFRRSGYSLNLFTSGYEALDFLKTQKADVIISDMRMPDMSGSEFLEKSIEFSHDSIRIIISGYEQKSVILNAVAKGFARHYIMKPWNDDELKTLVADGIKLKESMCQKRLEKFFHKIDNLPSPPKIYQKLIEILQKDPTSQREIAVEIEKSPVLVAKLLRISNSIYFGIRKEITTVLEAMAFIGTETVLNIVIGLESFNNLYKNADKEVIRKSEELRLKSVKRAQLSRKIAGLMDGNINPHEAYIAGLMLDIGLLFRFSLSLKEFNEYLEMSSKGEYPPYIVDKKLFSVTHDEVGEMLLTYWNFAGEIVHAVAKHHSSINDDPLTKIVQIADYLIQGSDSKPHDPLVVNFAEELMPELKNFLEDMKIEDMV